MEILKRKGFVQKIIITLIVLIMFNFIVPNYAMASFGWGWGGGSLAGPICEFVCWVGDSIIGFLQHRFLPNSPEIVTKKIPIDFMYNSISNEMIKLALKKDEPGITDEEKDSIDKQIDELRKLSDEIVKEKEEHQKLVEQNSYSTEAALEGDIDTIVNKKFYEQDIINIFYGPLTIFSNLVPALDVNFINPELSYGGVEDINYGVSPDGTAIYVESYVMKEPEAEQQYAGNIAKSLQREIASWYNALRNLAIVFLLSVLIYIAIRIILSSAAGETAKYKSMLKDWLIALCILFFMHYFMAFLLKSTEMITQFLTTNSSSQMYVDGFMSELRYKIPLESNLDQWADTVMYFTLVCYTLMFTWRYLKRVVYLAFLTVISPLVAFTYPIDKIKDGSAQAFNKWFKEYLYNILIQPVHLLLYTVLITSAKDLAHTNILYSLVALGFMLEAEKIVKDFFGLSAQRGESTGAAITGGAIFAATVGLVQKGLGFLPEGDGGKGDKSKPRHSSRQKDNEAGRRVENAWGGGSDEENVNRLPRGSFIDSAGNLTLDSKLAGRLNDKQKAELVEKAKGLTGMDLSQGANVLNNMVNEMLNGDSQTVTNSIRNTNTSNTNMLDTNTSNISTSNISTSNTSDSNIPGNIGQATIQHATIQNATINQGAMQAQGSSRTIQTGAQQANAQSGEQISNGGSSSNGGIPQFIKPYEEVKNENSSKPDSKDEKEPTERERRRQGRQFVRQAIFNKDNGTKFGKKLLRLGLMGAGAATFGTMGLGAGLAGNGTDDVVKYTGMGLGLGAVAGKKGYGTIMGAIDIGKDMNETYNEGYWGQDYQDKYYGPKLDKEYKNDPEVRKHYQMYYGNDWETALNQAIELRKMGITDQDDIDIALQRVHDNNKDLSLEQVASIMQLYKAYSQKDLEDEKYQKIIYRNAMKTMTNGNKQAAARIVNAVMNSRKTHGRFEIPQEDEEENT